MKRLCNLDNTKNLGQILTTTREFDKNIESIINKLNDETKIMINDEYKLLKQNLNDFLKSVINVSKEIENVDIL